MSTRSTLVVTLLLLVPALAFAPTAEACGASLQTAGVPCGRIYPFILIKVADQPPRYEMAQGEALVIEAEVTYKFNINDNGYSAAGPNEPVVVTFEYPRKPDWAELVVEPSRLEIPVNDPRYLQPNADDPNNVQAEFSYTVPITVTARLNGQQPVLRDGYDFAKLLVFAKSTESGLYQSGYGIKELRVLPEGFVYESTLAGSKDVFTATPLSTAAGGSVQSWAVAGTSFMLDMPSEVSFWQPTPVTLRLSKGVMNVPERDARVMFTVTDEAGALVSQHGPVPAVDGRVFNVTFVQPGLHRFALTYLGEPGTHSPSLSHTMALQVGALGAEGYAFPKSYLVAQRNTVPVPSTNADDPLVQFEQEIPFFAFDTAQSTVANVALVTPGMDAAARALTNLEFAIIDAEGKQLQANTLDPTNPVRSIRIGSLPGDGWYALRVKGTGAPGVSAYDVRIEASYALAPEARSRSDGSADVTGPMLSLAGRNLTLPTEGLEVWLPGDITPTLEGFSNAAYWVTVSDVEGRVVYASGGRLQEPATFTPPGPGTFHATVFVEPVGGPVFAPIARTFTFTVGEGTSTVAKTFKLEDEVGVRTSPTMGGLAVYRVPVPAQPESASIEFTAPPSGRVRAVLVDAEGKEAEVAASGALTLDPRLAPYTLVVFGQNAGPEANMLVSLTQSFAQPVTLEDMGGGPAPEAPAKVKIPGLAIGIALAAVGLVAVAVALVRKP